jgi:hypothetical protein
VVKVPATFTLAGQVAGGHQIADDALRLTFRYFQGICNIAQSRARVARDQEQRVAVIGQ